MSYNTIMSETDKVDLAVTVDDDNLITLNMPPDTRMAPGIAEKVGMELIAAAAKCRERALLTCQFCGSKDQLVRLQGGDWACGPSLRARCRRRSEAQA